MAFETCNHLSSDSKSPQYVCTRATLETQSDGSGGYQYRWKVTGIHDPWDGTKGHGKVTYVTAETWKFEHVTGSGIQAGGVVVGDWRAIPSGGATVVLKYTDAVNGTSSGASVVINQTGGITSSCTPN